MVDIDTQIKSAVRTIVDFCIKANGLHLRKYQVAVAEAIVNSIIQERGDTIIVMFPRQSGKNELQAQLESYLLSMYKDHGPAEMVKVSPTWKPQTQNAMRRLERVCKKSLIARHFWSKEAGYIFRFNQACLYFFSGQPTANVVGATASLLLQCDEAQDVLISKWDKDFAPMAASTNATRVFWGTAWTSKTLLARELRAAKKAEKKDGVQRVFQITADQVAKEVPAYGKFVASQVARFGRNHPIVKTQYFSEEIDAETGMFPAQRLALMQGNHPPQDSPEPGSLYALLVDVAGEASDSPLRGGPALVRVEGPGVQRPQTPLPVDGEGPGVRSNPPLRGGPALVRVEGPGVRSNRDSTALTVVQIDLATLSDELIKAPTYRVVHRYLWTGKSQTKQYAEIKAIAEHWQVRRLVIDATGIGAGLASFLDKAFPHQVIPFVFSSKSKSDLGWAFLAIIETGRFKDYVIARSVATKQSPRSNHQTTQLSKLFFRQCEYCEIEIMEGQGRVMRWSVPEGTRDAETGEPVHDDLVLSAALCAVLDEQSWGTAQSEVVHQDVLEGLVEVY